MMKESNAMSVLHTFSIKLADVSIKNNTSYVLITSPPFPLSKGGNFFAFGENRSYFLYACFTCVSYGKRYVQTRINIKNIH